MTRVLLVGLQPQAVDYLDAGAVAKNADRQAGVIHVLDAKLLAGVLVVAQLNPLEGYVASVQEVADGVGGRAPTLAVKTDGSGLLRTQTLQVDR